MWIFLFPLCLTAGNLDNYDPVIYILESDFLLPIYHQVPLMHRFAIDFDWFFLTGTSTYLSG